MRKLQRFDIMDYAQVEEKYQEFKKKLDQTKKFRRIFLGEKLLFLFENTDMVKNHILETVRRDKLFDEHDLNRLLDIYNQLIAGPGELRCTMIILNDIEWERSKRVKLWKELSAHIYLVMDDGHKVYGESPEVLVANQHPCSMRVLKFACGNQFPKSLGADYPDDSGYYKEIKLTTSQQNALHEDLEPEESDDKSHLAETTEELRYRGGHSWDKTLSE